jgi:hypothetical protein
MGLDMYLKKKTYIGGNWSHRKVTGSIKLKINTDTKLEKLIEINPENVTEIVEHCGDWRKANSIHGWIVKNVQDNIDECQESYFPNEKLTELRDVCKKVLKNKNLADKLLPPTSGFFFGSSEVNEWYEEDLQDTIEIINKLDLEHGEHYYQASW